MWTQQLTNLTYVNREQVRELVNNSTSIQMSIPEVRIYFSREALGDGFKKLYVSRIQSKPVCAVCGKELIDSDKYCRECSKIVDSSIFILAPWDVTDIITSCYMMKHDTVVLFARPDEI